jgi:hypothetical protein
MLPQGQAAVQVGLERQLRTIDPQIAAHRRRRSLRYPLRGLEFIRDHFVQTQLFCHIDLRRKEAGRFDLFVEQGLKARSEATDVDGFDVFERHVLLQPVRNVEMASGPHAAQGECHSNRGR